MLFTTRRERSRRADKNTEMKIEEKGIKERKAQELEEEKHTKIHNNINSIKTRIMLMVMAMKKMKNECKKDRQENENNSLKYKTGYKS